MDSSVSIDLQPRDGKIGPGSPAPAYSSYGYSSPGPGPAQGFPVQQPSRDFVLWSLFNTMFCNVCCLGFLALIFSFKARDRKVLGDTDGAGSYGKTAKCLNITVLVLSLLTLVLIIILMATGVVALSHAVQQQNPNRVNFDSSYGK